jgi:hypothetical protein
MARASDAILKIAWMFAAAVCAFTTENLWIDPWLQRKSHHKLPSFVPEALGGAWFLILLALVITVIQLIVCQVLLMRDPTLPKRKKAVTGILVAAAALLSGAWFATTSGTTLATRSGQAGAPQKRSVVLRWQPSTTPDVRYNVYRGPFWGIHPDKLNSTPIEGTSFTDGTVVNGQTYWYIVRAVNAKGEESFESNVAEATIP